MFSKLFKREEVDCPRCLGKGHVDREDITRLGKELYWNPGRCAYCNGRGRVDPKMLLKVKVDTAYLVTNLEEHERELLLNRNEAALKRARSFENTVGDFIRQIEYLHFIGKMSSENIAGFFLLNEAEEEVTQKEELIEYINRVIENRKPN